MSMSVGTAIRPSALATTLQWAPVSVSLPVHSSVSACAQAVSRGEVVQRHPSSQPHNEDPSGKHWMNGGNKNMLYAAFMKVHPQSTTLITTSLQFKKLKSNQGARRERTCR